MSRCYTNLSNFRAAVWRNETVGNGCPWQDIGTQHSKKNPSFSICYGLYGVARGVSLPIKVMIGKEGIFSSSFGYYDAWIRLNTLARFMYNKVKIFKWTVERRGNSITHLAPFFKEGREELWKLHSTFFQFDITTLVHVCVTVPL